MLLHVEKYMKYTHHRRRKKEKRTNEKKVREIEDKIE